MNTLTIKLKQHTPLIHFQHDQDGATLRASEVKPKLDKYILIQLGAGDYEKGKAQAKAKGWLVGKGDHPALDYKMRILDNPDNIIVLNTNEKKRCYNKKDEEKDIKKGKTISKVHYGDIIDNNIKHNVRFVILGQDKKEYFGKFRKTDSKIIYDLDSYPCFFANMDADIKNSDEYRKITYAKDPFGLLITTQNHELYNFLNDKNKSLLSFFFLENNFGTRQSKGFGSFYIDESDDLYREPYSRYHFSVPITDEYYYEEFFTLFKIIELFTKTLRAGINEKRGIETVFYFKSLAFMYCKDILNAEWDKKKVKTEFYFGDTVRRKDSLSKQRDKYPNDCDHDILFFDSSDGYDIRDLLGFSTNEEWLSYKDSIEKKVALQRGKTTVYPRREDVLPVDRMRSPLLIKPICKVDDNDNDNVNYTIHLLFQDKEVGMEMFKLQKEICFFSKREKDERGFSRRFMIKLPQTFSLYDYFDYIFGRLRFDISTHVEDKYQEHEYYGILEDIYSQLKECQ